MTRTIGRTLVAGLLWGSGWWLRSDDHRGRQPLLPSLAFSLPCSAAQAEPSVVNGMRRLICLRTRCLVGRLTSCPAISNQFISE